MKGEERLGKCCVAGEILPGGTVDSIREQIHSRCELI